ncbi:hypothetical protein F5I97DRAFT_1898909 [Phlebopus sp. FC_14]|nr:hypothetical protein F5I97DRAFT_1898909 [Phlebopus sp. FC_14]
MFTSKTLLYLLRFAMLLHILSLFGVPDDGLAVTAAPLDRVKRENDGDGDDAFWYKLVAEPTSTVLAVPTTSLNKVARKDDDAFWYFVSEPTSTSSGTDS